jgi:hypothetical protein
MTGVLTPARYLVRHLSARSFTLAAVITAFGLVSAGMGIVIAVAAATPVAAAGLSIPGCAGVPVTLAPGDSGSCNTTFNLSGHGSPGQVFLNVTTTSTSEGAGVGTEALIDGIGTGLQITLIDATSGNTYGIGTVGCTGTYPDATPCSSSDSMQSVSSSSITADTDVITVSWNFPIQASNPYQGGKATVNLQEAYSGGSVPPAAISTPSPTPTPTPTSGVLGAHTTPTPSPNRQHHSGVLGASTSTPTTGAQVPIIFSRVLIVLGLALILVGLWVWRRQRYFRHS